jgi:5-aminovalerate/4-aminobutyrate aminotransferase
MSATNAEWLTRRSNAVARGVSVTHPLFIAHATNSTVTDVEGREFIDFCGGIAVMNVGHAHSGVVAAVQAQVQRFTHLCFMVLGYDSYVELCEQLNRLVPSPGNVPKKTALFVSGSEAVENAVKVARAFTKREAVIAFSGAYHGRTFMTMTLNGKKLPYARGMGMVGLPWVFRARFPNALHGVSVDDSLQSIHDIFKMDCTPDNVAAIIIEPVQGEGGFYAAPRDFMLRLRALCDEHGIVLIADEVQTGIGRTGTMFAMEQMGCAADITTFAKSIGGGVPIAGITGRANVIDAVDVGGLGGTYGGPPLATAAALEVLRAFERDNLLDRAKHVGALITERMQRAQKLYPAIADVRGLGAMIAIELLDAHHKPDAANTAKIVAVARDNGLLLLSCGLYGNVIRFLCPLTIPDDILNRAMDILDKTFAKVFVN